MNIHRLDGCAPAPLAHYLKALGILRLVAEQADPGARGWWSGDRFLLATALDREELETFFLDRYEPTPLISPWNKGSGFYYEEDPALTPLENSEATRFERFRSGISAGRPLTREMADADREVRRIKDEAKGKSLSAARRKALKASEEYKKRLAEAERRFKQLKADLIPRLRLAWRGPHREWMDAAMVLREDGTPAFPALLGTGGNDGRLDFTNNFMQRLNDLFDLSASTGEPRDGAADWFAGALWDVPTPGCQSGKAVGQYLPGGAGGANSGNGPTGDSLLNPADFLLMMEGSVLFAAHVTRRTASEQPGRAAAPFAVNAHGAGYASAAGSDEGARGEQWMPLWSRPTTLSELKRLLAEGRAQIGARPAREPLDMARAVARLGSARGIRAFQRYGYIERNGQSNLAVPIGRIPVPDRVFPQLSCLDDLDRWLNGLRRAARDKHAPSRLQMVERRLSDALFAVAVHPDEPARWQAVLFAMADVESVLRTGSGHKAGPIPLLRPEWISAANDGSPDFRLAVAFALQSSGDPLRRHWLPLDKWQRGFATSGTGGERRLESSPAVVMNGRSGADDCIAVVQRRLVEAARGGQRTPSLLPGPNASARPGDLGRLLAGNVDIDRAMRLARGLLAADRRKWRTAPVSLGSGKGGSQPDDAWIVVRLACLPFPLPPEDRQIPFDSNILRRLEAGDAVSAVNLALRRLRSAGIRATVRAAAAPPETARLWAAALAFPIHSKTARNFLARIDPNTIEENNP